MTLLRSDRQTGADYKLFFPDALTFAHLALANAESFALAAALIVDFFGAAFFWAGAVAVLLGSLFLAAHFAFIKAESLALAAADIGLRLTGACLFAGAGLPALMFSQRALATLERCALAAADMPELD